MTTKAKKILFITVKIIILLATLMFLHVKLIKTGKWNDFLVQFQSIGEGNTLIFLIIGVLMLPFNTGLEAKKWQYLTKKIQNISFKRSWYAVFSGVTLNLFTPFNLGDYAARTLYLEDNNKLKGAMFTFICGMGQLVVTLVLGLLSLPFYFLYFGNFGFTLGLVLSAISILLALSIFWGFFNIPVIFHWFRKFIKDKKIRVYIRLIENLSKFDLSKTLRLSFFKFLVYSSQYYFFLRFFGIDGSIILVYPLLCLVFFTQSLIPTFALVSFGIRGAAAIFFLGLISQNHAGILAASLSLWLVNFILSGLIGLLIIFSFNFVRGVNR